MNQSTSTLTYVYINKIRKDIFGKEIKKGGKDKINFADNIILKDDKINKNSENNIENKLDNIVEIIDVVSYLKGNIIELF